MKPGSAEGYSFIELLVSVAVLSLVMGTTMTGIMQLTRANGTISNRTGMHAGVRNATELLQQEVGQAGRIALPAPVTLTGAVGGPGVATVGVTSASGMFVGERLVIGTGLTEETVNLTGVNTAGNTITASFLNAHAAGANVFVHGGFAQGVLPTTVANGSSATVLKLFGDINGDGQMVYVEFVCDTVAGNLYRRSMPFNAALKPAITQDQSLLNNVVPNPGGTPCFTYQQKNASGQTYVVDVAITLTVQTANRDPQTGLFQRETKALLNVSPRNVFNVWQLAGLGYQNRVQPTPASVTALLP